MVDANLPLDVTLKILDELELEDVYNTVLGFNWQLGPGYWRARFPCDVIFEIGRLELDERQWRYVYRELATHEMTPKGWAFGQRDLRTCRK